MPVSYDLVKSLPFYHAVLCVLLYIAVFTVALNSDESIVKFDPFRNVFSTVTRRQRLIDSLHAGLGFLATHTSV